MGLFANRPGMVAAHGDAPSDPIHAISVHNHKAPEPASNLGNLAGTVANLARGLPDPAVSIGNRVDRRVEHVDTMAEHVDAVQDHTQKTAEPASDIGNLAGTVVNLAYRFFNPAVSIGNPVDKRVEHVGKLGAMSTRWRSTSTQFKTTLRRRPNPRAISGTLSIR